MNISDIKKGIIGLTKDQMLDLNKFLCAEIRALNHVGNAIAINQLAPGDAVYFVHRGVQIPAIVDKTLRTNVDVTTLQGKKWRVAAHLLQKRN